MTACRCVDEAGIFMVAEFLLDHGVMSLWSPEQVRELLEFYTERRAVGLVNRQQQLVGVGLARPVMRVRVVERRLDPWEWNDFGDTLYIQTITAESADLIPVLWGMMVGRFGRRPWAAGRRHDMVRVWPFSVYEQRMSFLEKKASV